jgi:hypothetical protein
MIMEKLPALAALIFFCLLTPWLFVRGELPDDEM